MGANIYVSKAFVGKIDKKQFNIPVHLKRRLQETNRLATSWLFYGGVAEETECCVISSTPN